MATSPDYKSMYGPIAGNAAIAAGVPTDLFSNLIASESSWNPYAFNSASGAAGIAQFMPDTAKGLAVNPYDPAAALTTAAGYLRTIYDTVGHQDWGQTVAYYKGETTNLKNGVLSADVAKVIGGTGVQTSLASVAPNNATNPATSAPGSTSGTIQEPTGPFIFWSFQDWRNFFIGNSAKVLFVVIGLVLILFALIALIFRSGGRTVSRVVSTASKVME